jgi:hypothetical protein
LGAGRVFFFYFLAEDCAPRHTLRQLL